MKHLVRFCALSGLISFTGFLSAAPLRNLSFEQADTNSTSFYTLFSTEYPSGQGPISDLLPGWQVFEGARQVSLIGYDSLVFGPSIKLVTTNTFPARFIVGRYAFDAGIGSGEPVSLVQRGEIPADTQYMDALLPFSPFGRQASVLIDNREIGRGFGGLFDVSQYVGREVELKFVFYRDDNNNTRTVDNIRFLPVPEPGPTTLFLIGTAVLAATSIRKRLT